MTLSRRKLEQLAAIAVAVMLMSLSGNDSWAQATKTTKIIVPYPPGGTNDTIARVLGEQVGRAQGRTIVVENRPGASTQIGTESASRAAPDGNSLLFAGPNFVFIPHLRKVNYDPLTSFEPICNLASTPVVILVNDASPYHTLAVSGCVNPRKGGVIAMSRWSAVDRYLPLVGRRGTFPCMHSGESEKYGHPLCGARSGWTAT